MFIICLVQAVHFCKTYLLREGVPCYLYTNVLMAFKERCFGYLLRQSGSRQSAVSHTSGKN